MIRALDLFAGPGGWDVAAHRLSINVLGIEWDPWRETYTGRHTLRTVTYEVVQARLVDAVRDAAEWIGADGVEQMVEATLHG